MLTPCALRPEEGELEVCDRSTEKKVLSNILKTQRAGYGQYAEDDDKIFNR